MGLVARVVEASGITTVLVSTGRDLTALVKPPRSLFVNFPMGNPFGRPHRVDEQRTVLLAALQLAERATVPGVLADFPLDWHEPFDDAVETALLGMTGSST